MTALAVAPEFLGEVHPYADRWPMLDMDATRALADDIAANGQWLPIVLDPQGRLIDGRNRLAACTLAGVEPQFVVDERLDSEDAIGAYIWSANGERRDMTKGQKALLAALRPGIQSSLSESTGVANGYIAKARVVLQWCMHDTIEAVIDGAMPLNDAYAEAQQIKATQQADEIAAKKAAAEAKRRADEDVARLAELRRVAPGYAALVDSGQMTIAGAGAAYLADTKKERDQAAAIADGIRKANVAVTEAVFRLHLLDMNPGNVAQWLATYAPADAIHPLNTTELRHAIAALTTLEAAL